MKNIGKKFEEDIMKSVPEHVLVHRLPDPSASFGGSEKTRFSNKNPFDFLLWDSEKYILYALEVKTVKGKSISFERDKKDKGTIHKHQIKGLNEWNKYRGIIAGFIIEFRSVETTIFIHIDTFNKLSELVTKKSFNISDLDDNNLPYFVIPQNKKRTRYFYDIESFLKQGGIYAKDSKVQSC